MPEGELEMKSASGEEAAAFFNRFAYTFDTLYDEQRGWLSRWVDRRFRGDMFIRFERTFEQFGDLTGQSVLDIGCGSGPYMLEALRRGARMVTGLDPAPNMLRLAHQRLARAGFSNRYQLLESMFPGPELEPHDSVIVMGVLDYVFDAQAFMLAMRLLTKRRAAVSFPSRHWLRTPLRKFRYRMRRCPVYFYDELEIRQLSGNAGFDMTELYKIPGAGMDFHVVLM